MGQSVPLRIVPDADTPGCATVRVLASVGPDEVGAGITVVDVAFVARYPALFTTLSSTTGTDATGMTREIPTVLMAGPQVGSVQFKPSVAAVVDLGAVNSTLDQPLDLILGYPLISQADWQFDLGAARWSTRLATAGAS